MFGLILVSFIVIASFILPFFVLKQNTKSRLHQLFFIFAQTNTVWAIDNLLTGIYPLEIWVRGMYGIGALLVSSGLAWFFYLLEGKINIFKYCFVYFFGFLFFFLSLFTDYVVKSVDKIYFGYFDGQFGSLFYIYSIFLSGSLIYIVFRLFRAAHRSIGIKKLQMMYVATGAFIFAFFAIILSFIFPIIFTNFFSQFDLTGSFIFLLFISYSIVKYRLMDIRVVLIRSILYTFLVAMVASFFALSVFLSTTYLGEENKSSNIIVYIITSFIIVIFLDPLKRAFAKITDRIFYKDRIDYQKVSQKASAVVAKEIDLDKLSYAISHLLATELKIKEVSTLIAKDKNFVLLSSSQISKSDFKLSPSFINFIQEHREFIIVEELIREQGDINNESPYYQTLDIFIREAESFNVEMVVPIADDNNIVTAILLFSAKSSGDLYNQDDINFLKVLVPQIGTAITKSKLYEEVQIFNRELQAKVEDRTKSLREANIGLEERNKFLTTMQVVTNMVSRTLDLKQVNQNIANSIALELGYVGGILSFIDESKHTLKIGAITDNEKTKDVISILGRDPKTFEAQLNPEFSLGAQTVLSGKINFSDKMSDFFSPPVEVAAIDKIQKFLGVKTVVGLPIFSENKIIGVIHFLMAVERHHISALDIETMTALTNQVGIVSRNLYLYNNLQSANAELQEANLRLRELDRAKSEFLSIASHQLRTPISALKGYLSMMIDGDFGPVPDKIKVVIKDLFESASRLARLINVFLNVSRIESGRLKLDKHEVQVNDLIVSVVKELNNQALQKKLELLYEEPKKTLPLINADSDKLREVILNLIDNSIKYTLTGSVKISVSVEANDFHFVVKDTGIGIDPEEAKTLFRKFVRGSGVAQIHTGGSGLGLFIAQKIIKEHGGKVWAESEGKGKGSTFQFVIPIDGNGEMVKIASAEEFK